MNITARSEATAQAMRSKTTTPAAESRLHHRQADAKPATLCDTRSMAVVREHDGSVTSADLTPVLGPGVEVVHLRRRGMPVDPGVLAVTLDRAACFDAKLRVDPGSASAAADVVARLVDALPAGPTRDALAADMVTLLVAYTGLRGGTAVQVGLWLGERVMCPKLHADNVGLRLLCTYLGPGTEWVPDAYVDRRHLCCAEHGPEEANRLIAPDVTKIVRAAPFDVVVLKGDAYPGNRGRGAVHRTPPDAGSRGKRLVFKIDDLPGVAGG